MCVPITSKAKIHYTVQDKTLAEKELMGLADCGQFTKVLPMKYLTNGIISFYIKHSPECFLPKIISGIHKSIKFLNLVLYSD